MTMDVRGVQAIATTICCLLIGRLATCGESEKAKTTAALSIKAANADAVRPRMMTDYQPTDTVNMAMHKRVGDNTGL